MRTVLAQRAGLRGVFRATFEKHGSRTSHGYEKPMLLFVDVDDASAIRVTDHLWFAQTKTWDELQLQPGDRVQFEARVTSYWKGYIDKTMDYKLAFPRHALVLNRHAPVDDQLELFRNA